MKIGKFIGLFALLLIFSRYSLVMPSEEFVPSGSDKALSFSCLLWRGKKSLPSPRTHNKQRQTPLLDSFYNELTRKARQRLLQ